MRVGSETGLVLCTACNHTYILGGTATIVSALVSLPEGTPPATIYVLDGGMRKQDWVKLEKSVNKVGEGHRLIRLLPDMTHFANLPKDWGSSVMTYARLALPFLVDEPRVVYLDADLLVQQDLSRFMEIDLEGKVVAAVRDIITKTLAGDSLPLEQLGLPPDSPYLQAGFLVIDLPLWRKQQVSDQVISYLRKYPEYATYWDQSALNVVLHGRWKQLEDCWNTPAWWADQAKSGTSLEDPILHFIGPHKPWLRGHHKTDSALKFFSVLDQTAWTGWRPSAWKTWLRYGKYRFGEVFKSLKA